MDELSRRLAPVILTDTAGYTALMHRDEAAALRSRTRHREALEEALGRRGGELLRYFGDGSLGLFRSALEAVEAAVAVQQALTGDPTLRIGIHAGAVPRQRSLSSASARVSRPRADRQRVSPGRRRACPRSSRGRGRASLDSLPGETQRDRGEP